MTPERWRQVDALFQQAAELSEEGRREFLAGACVQDPELRREVELLLQHDAHSTGPALVSALQSGLRVWANRGQDLVGKHVGPYRILQPLGRGGMGAVFLAVRDDDQFQKQVAIKLVRGDMDTEAILQRFRQERQILANLQHPNIAQLLDGGVTHDGMPYFALEYIEGGKPITQYCNEHALSVAARLELFRQACAAVQYAHQNLVIHRDLKPGNILVTESGQVKLLDFGIAKVLEPSPGDGQSQTNTGMQMLTPEYASPEQVRGEPVSTASDVYMLGAVLYELLTGEKAHKLKDYSPLQITDAICNTITERPSLVAQPALRRHLEGDLDNIVLMALRKERERRYSSVEALSEDIRRHLEGLPVSAREDTVIYRSGKFIRRNRILVTAAVVVAASLVAGISVAVVQARRAERRFQQVRKLANTFLFSFHDKIRNLQGSTEAREFVVTTALEYLDSLAGEAGNDLTLREELANAYLRVSSVQGDPRVANLGHTDAAMASLKKAEQIAGSILQRDPTHRGALRVVASSYSQEGDMLTAAGKSKEAIAAQNKSVEAAERLARRPDAEAQDLNLLLQALLRKGDLMLDDAPAESLATYKSAREVAGRMQGVATDELAKVAIQTSHQRLGRVSHELGDPEAGIRNYQESERLVKEFIRDFPKNVRYERELMVIYNFLGNYSGHDGYFNVGNPRAALDYYRKAGELQQKLAADSKNVLAQTDRAIGATKLGEAYMQVDQAEAVRQGRSCVENMDSLLASAPANFLYLRIRQNCLSVLGRALLAAGNSSESVKVLSDSLRLSEALLARTPKDISSLATVAGAANELATAYLGAKNWVAAEQQLARALAILEQAHKDLPTDLHFLRDLADAQENMGRLRKGQGNRANAAQWYRKALDSWDQWGKIGKYGPYVANHQKRLRAEL